MSFELQPTLEGQLVRLRPLRADDYDDLFAVASDPLIWQVHPNWDRYKPEVFKEFFRVGLESGGALLAIDAASGDVIGSSRYFGYSAERSEVEIGWSFLRRTHWGGAYNREMKRLMLAHAFQFVNRVTFWVGMENWRSQRALEKIGATRVGVLQNHTGTERVVFEMMAANFRG